MVAKPSPPEICWHLMRPPGGFTAGLAGSLGCAGVEVGHCTLKLCAATGSAHKARSAAAIPLPNKRVLSIKPPSGTFRACGAHNHGVGEISRAVRNACCRKTGFVGRHGYLAHRVVVDHLVLFSSAGPYMAPTWRLVVVPGGPVLACCPLARRLRLLALRT